MMRRLGEKVAPAMLLWAPTSEALGLVTRPFALDLGELADQLPIAAVQIVFDRLPLCIEAKAGFALLVSRNPVVSYEFPLHVALHSHRKLNLSIKTGLTPIFLSVAWAPQRPSRLAQSLALAAKAGE
jgi:hypothetical protein